MTHKPWRLDHDPLTRPLGCNGRPGDSGRKVHKRRGEPICPKCQEAGNHAVRERRRGSPNPRRLNPCGTPAAARRHRYKGEPVDLLCRAAEANYHADHRRKTRAVPIGAASYVKETK